MASRPLVTIQSPKAEKKSTIPFPDVLTSPIRVDLVLDVHTRMNKNHRQPYAVSKIAGEQTSARSWGTGRAVSRIPRVAGGGTHRSGQGAFGNMCRGGRMFAPTKVWRKWHIRISKGQRRFATCSALAGSALAPLVMARGHRIDAIAEVPLVVADSEIDTIVKTKEAIALLKSLGAGDDLERVKDSHAIRAGKGKARNRRYVQRRGPLLIHNKERGNPALFHAFRNIQGLDLCNVNRLNLLQLAPGGHVGRFVIWTESAFKQLDSVFGTYSKDSEQKSGFRPPVSVLTNADIGKIMSSPEVQKALRPSAERSRASGRQIGNPLTNFRSMVKLNPYAKTQKEAGRQASAQSKAARSQEAAKKGSEKRKAAVKKNRAFVASLLTPAIAPVRGPEEYPPF